jgi:ABC-type lipoprotein export system ATPase subunit
MAVTPPILTLSNVTKRFAEPLAGQPVDVLRGITLDIRAGQSIAVTGPSGSGKSTLLNILGTLDRPTSGSVCLDGRDLSRLSDPDLARIRNASIGLIFQSHHLLPQCTVLENVLVPTLAAPKDARRVTAPDRARQLLHRVGLSHRLHHRPGQLSGGERQRVAVVRALVNQPRLLLADEPTGALDRVAADALANLLVDLNREDGVTLIVVTHARHLAAQMKSQLELRDGQLQDAA